MTSKTTIDWLRFRTQAEVGQTIEALRGLFGEMGPALRAEHLAHGRDGFQRGAALHLQDLAIGEVHWGGDAMRGWVRVNITGQGCEWVRDWDAVEALEALPASELRRNDIALTTWANEVDHDMVVGAHGSGMFTTRGRPPEMRVITSSDPRAGRTVYVGARTGEKYFRGYEKGFQLLSKLPRQLADTCSHIYGFPVEGIYRLETEFKAVDRPLPWEMVERRDQYFAGSYPYLASVLPDVQADIMQRRPERLPQTSLAAALANCRIQYGSTLRTALEAYHGDISAVWGLIVGDKLNADLVAAGVLMVEHP